MRTTLTGASAIPNMAMVTIRVRDLAATQRALQHGGFSAALLRAGIAVPAAEAMNCTIAFVQ